MEKLHKAYQGKPIEVVGVNVKDTEAGRKEFVEANGLTYPMLIDTDMGVAQAYNVRGLPTVVLIDKAGKIRYQGFGLPEPSVIDAVL